MKKGERKKRTIAEILKRPFFDSYDVAKLLSSDDDPWTVQRARRWMLSSGVGVRQDIKRTGPVTTSRQRLIDHVPDMMDKRRREFAEAEESETEDYRFDADSDDEP